MLMEVGPVIHIDKESASFLTNELVVKLKSHITQHHPAFGTKFRICSIRFGANNRKSLNNRLQTLKSKGI
jgi:hypothetical protein